MSPRPAPPKPDACERCGAAVSLCLWDWVPAWVCDDTSACERRLAAQRSSWVRVEVEEPTEEELEAQQERWERRHTHDDV